MIEVTIRHSSAYDWSDEDVVSIRDWSESTIGSFFGREQEHVDVTLLPYGGSDEHGAQSKSTDLLVKIDFDLSADSYVEDVPDSDDLFPILQGAFGAVLRPDAFKLRVWLRPIIGGTFSE